MAETAATTNKPTARRRKPAARRPAPKPRSLVERAALTYVGATLAARDRVVDAANSVVGTFTAGELRKRQARYERRGTTSRNRFERDAKQARARFEGAVRRNRGEVTEAAQRIRDKVSGLV